MSTLASGKMDKYEYLASEEIPTCDQICITEQAKLTYSPLGKSLEKQSKTIQYQGERQINAIEKRFEKQLFDTDQNQSVLCF